MRYSAVFICAISMWGADLPERSASHPILSFSMNESVRDLALKFAAQPESSFGSGYRLYQFHQLPDRAKRRVIAEPSCDGQYPWVFSYDPQTNEMLAVIHEAVEPIPTEQLFPTEQRILRQSPAKNAWAIVRKLDGNRVLLAIVATPDQLTISQILLLHPKAVQRLYPWIVEH